ncbi:MAG TPA: DEAD/DEAH box helicase family protein, partial [Agitococcus sp.]|nr:DEAD/DEAH box helicase family protein [Agitococcus sp.]
MELKDYQQRVIADLNEYLTVLENTQQLDIAFKQYWAEKSVTDITPYKNNVANVPHVCIKVPTAGGKTFIAVNAIKTIFDCFARTNPKLPQFVVWLVPSLSILEQTVKALANPEHPYRKQLNIDFRHRVAVYQKHDLLMAADFSLDTVQQQLSIVVMSFDSLRAKNKEDRKIYQDNGYLASFLNNDNHQNELLADYDASALINVMRSLKPVIIVDESHNAETILSVEMLKNLNPNFILDLTATPKNNSNIISYVDAMQLKKQHMVKLPVIVSNHQDKHKVIEEALILRQQLENIAIQQQKDGGKYIRPIILFQAQAKTADDNTTFEKIKEFLVSVNVPAEQIKIKTAQINELKNIDLLSPQCPVRYIITVNALKEGWDCPFAYVLASLADKSSAVDVEQILGRVLRMPHVQQHGHDLLNMSYVLTASTRFLDTLQSIVKALNKAGFSDKDYRRIEPVTAPLIETKPQQPAFNFEVVPQAMDMVDDFDCQKIPTDWQNFSIHTELVEGVENSSTIGQAHGAPQVVVTDTINTPLSSVSQLMQQAMSQNQHYQAIANQIPDNHLPMELEAKVNKYAIKEMFWDEVTHIKLPQFVMKSPNGGFFAEVLLPLERDWLLDGFKLAYLDATISFEHIDTEMYQVDLEQIGNHDYAPKPFKMDYVVREKFNSYILSLNKEGQILNLTDRLFKLIGNLYPLDDEDVKSYIGRIIAQMSHEQ